MVHAPGILIIDSNTVTCFISANILKRAGYNVSTALDGHDGLAKALREGPQCLLLDIVLPKISGFELCRQLRAKDPHRRHGIILLGNRDNPVDRKWALRQGADRYIARPFTEEELAQLVREVLIEHSFITPPPQNIVSPQPAIPQQPELPSWLKLVPHRSENPELLMTHNPLKDSIVIADKQARRLYSAINGKRSIEDISRITSLDVKEIYKAIHILLAEHRIQLRTQQGLPADRSQFFKEL